VEAVHITRNPIVKGMSVGQRSNFLLTFPNDQSDAIAATVQTEYTNSTNEDRADKDGVSRRNNFIRDDPARQTDKSGSN
jgi:hypothetical protein